MLLRSLEELHANARSPSYIRELCWTLRRHSGVLSLEDCARKLAVSERALQRKLQQSGTTFRAECNKVKLEHAQANDNAHTDRMARSG